MLKRGLLNKLPYTFNGYYLVNDHNDVHETSKTISGCT